MSGRSTVTNLLVTDAHIVELASTGHSIDIISFDFAKAFDKAPYHAIINALAEHGIRGTALRWFQSFLSEKRQQVHVNSCYLIVERVALGVIQGSEMGPGLYTVFIDSLFQCIRLPVTAFADDVKFVADVITLTEAKVQSDINSVVALYVAENYTPLSLDKCGLLQCGKQKYRNNYYINGAQVKSVDSFLDLGVIRTTVIADTMRTLLLKLLNCMAPYDVSFYLIPKSYYGVFFKFISFSY